MKTKDGSRKWMWWFLAVVLAMQLYFVRHGESVAKDPARAVAELGAIAELGAQAHGELRAVIEAFVRLYEEGLIFRAKRMINWDPASETVVSDLEVDTAEEDGSLWEIRYPIVGASADGAFTESVG